MEHATPSRFHTEVAAGAVAFQWPEIFVAPLPALALRACIIIPAKDEAQALPATLAALAAQVDAQGQPLPADTFEVLVLVNNSLDATARVARAFAAAHPHLTLHVAEVNLPPAEAHVGRARRLLMDAACRRLQLAGHPNAFIASTDADTQVAPDWLAATAAAIAAGADAVGGRILMADANATCPVRRCQLRDATYHLLRMQLETQLDPAAHDPWPRHHQHFGASLAITQAAYRAVGGLPVVPYLEDEALYQLLLLHDLRVRHSPAVRVFTSSRQQGRVAVGLSWQLREWADLGRQEPLVPHPAAWAAELRARHALRKTWQAAAEAEFPHPPSSQQAISQTFGACWQRVQPGLRAAEEEKYAPLPLREAIRHLRQLVAATAPAPEPAPAAELACLV